jgi:hypothetical protein
LINKEGRLIQGLDGTLPQWRVRVEFLSPGKGSIKSTGFTYTITDELMRDFAEPEDLIRNTAGSIYKAIKEKLQ